MDGVLLDLQLNLVAWNRLECFREVGIIVDECFTLAGRDVNRSERRERMVIEVDVGIIQAQATLWIRLELLSPPDGEGTVDVIRVSLCTGVQAGGGD